ncbi:hypothetical protein HanRHA438_Chr13g0600501 [Helianthus annuus]|nr:hypothetical protein HanRHA438_Chr13g0600501 [Helianthus annuus]
MFSFDFRTSEALRHIRGDVLLHTRPPIGCTKTVVHLISTRMNRVLGFVCLVHDEFTKIVAIWHPDAIKVVLKSI